MYGFKYLVVAASLIGLAGCGGRSPDGNVNQGETANQGQVNEIVPANQTAAAETGPTADNAAAPATSGRLDHAYLVGRWSETEDCADATEFRADGSFVLPWGDTGTWRLEGDRLTLSTNTGSVRLSRVNQNQLNAISPGGAVHRNKRC
jgi:hypothetical protein